MWELIIRFAVETIGGLNFGICLYYMDKQSDILLHLLILLKKLKNKPVSTFFTK